MFIFKVGGAVSVSVVVVAIVKGFVDIILTGSASSVIVVGV